MGKKRRQSADEAHAKEKVELNIGEFASEHRRLKRMIKRRDFDSSTAATQLTKTLLAMTIEMLPKVEKTFNDTEGSKGVYAVINLSNLLRELTNDLRAMSDQSAIVDRIMESCIDVALKVLSTSIHNELTNINGQVTEHVPAKSREKVLRVVEQAKIELLDRVGGLRDGIQGQIGQILES